MEQHVFAFTRLQREPLARRSVESVALDQRLGSCDAARCWAIHWPLMTPSSLGRRRRRKAMSAEATVARRPAPTTIQTADENSMAAIVSGPRPPHNLTFNPEWISQTVVRVSMGHSHSPPPQTMSVPSRGSSDDQSRDLGARSHVSVIDPPRSRGANALFPNRLEVGSLEFDSPNGERVRAGYFLMRCATCRGAKIARSAGARWLRRCGWFAHFHRRWGPPPAQRFIEPSRGVDTPEL